MICRGKAVATGVAGSWMFNSRSTAREAVSKVCGVQVEAESSEHVNPSEDPGMYDEFMPETHERKGPGRGGASTRRSYIYMYRGDYRIAASRIGFAEERYYLHFRNDPHALFGGKGDGSGE